MKTEVTEGIQNTVKDKERKEKETDLDRQKNR